MDSVFFRFQVGDYPLNSLRSPTFSVLAGGTLRDRFCLSHAHNLFTERFNSSTSLKSRPSNSTFVFIFRFCICSERFRLSRNLQWWHQRDGTEWRNRAFWDFWPSEEPHFWGPIGRAFTVLLPFSWMDLPTSFDRLYNGPSFSGTTEADRQP